MYDSKKDILKGSITMEGENSDIEFSIYSYDNGEPKLQMTRRVEKKDGSKGFAKLGRMTKDEVKFMLDHKEEIINLLQRVVDIND